MSFAGVAAAVGVAGLALTAKGQADAKKANKNALAQEKENFDKQTEDNWKRYMLSRGMDPTSGKAVNTKLPFWASVTNRPGAKTVFTPSSSMPTGIAQ